MHQNVIKMPQNFKPGQSSTQNCFILIYNYLVFLHDIISFYGLTWIFMARFVCFDDASCRFLKPLGTKIENKASKYIVRWYIKSTTLQLWLKVQILVFSYYKTIFNGLTCIFTAQFVHFDDVSCQFLRPLGTKIEINV